MKLKVISSITVFTSVLVLVCCSPRSSGIIFRNSIPIAINDTKEIRQRDSLVNVITTIPFEKPSDLNSTTLIIELYTYRELMSLYSTKFSKELPSPYRIFHYPGYKNWAREKLFTQYAGSKTWKKSKKYSRLSSENYRYVIKTTTRTVVESDSLGGAVLNSFVYYLFDRKQNKIYGEIKDTSGTGLN